MSAQLAIEALEKHARALQERSDELTKTQRRIDAIQSDYDDFIRDFEVDLYEKCVEKAARLPGDKDLRRQMALKAMPSGFRRDYEALIRKRDRLRKAIADLKAGVDAWRSVLSAEKVTLEAGGA